MERRFSISADDEYAASADALHRATHILVAAGAGASADSGLPTYTEMPAAYNDLCRAEIFLERPEYGYGFWAGCVRDYRKAAPHAGLNILERPSNLRKERVFRDPRLIIFYAWMRSRYAKRDAYEILMEEYKQIE